MKLSLESAALLGDHENEPIRFHVASSRLTRTDDGIRLIKAMRYLKEFLTTFHCQNTQSQLLKKHRRRCEARSALDFEINFIDDPFSGSIGSFGTSRLNSIFSTLSIPPYRQKSRCQLSLSIECL